MSGGIAGKVEETIKAPEFRGASLELGPCRDIEVCLDGPAGTGKTFAALYKIHLLLTLYPYAKALVARKTNTALSGSAMATFRDMLHPSEGVKYFGGNKVKPAAFEYPNGSMMIVSGLDKPEKVKSWEFDIAFLNEATEINLEDLEFVRSRMRHGKLPYHQVIMDTNPGPPTHWLNQRMNAGITRRLLSRHQDNPRYFDTRTQDWTPEGRSYIFDVLGGLTGVRLKRYRDGVWCASEGMVYEDEWDPYTHLINRIEIMPLWQRFWVLDFGYRNPFVWQAWAMDHDGTLYRYHEIYRTGVLVEDMAREIMQVTAGEPRPVAIICDHDAEDRATFERHTGLGTIAARKAVSRGIQVVKARLRTDRRGKAGMYFLRDSLIGCDMELQRKSLPTCTETEFESYVWNVADGRKIGEEPVKKFDHGQDCNRYLAMYHDGGPNSVEALDQETADAISGYMGY